MSTASRMDWDRYRDLETLDLSGDSVAALSGFLELLPKVGNPEEKAVVLLAIAGCFRNLNREVEAREAVSKVFRLLNKRSETFAWALLFDVRLQMDEGRWEKALAELDDLASNFVTLLQYPENQDSLETVERRRGVVLYELHRPKEALRFLERASSRDAEKATVLYYLGRCCYDLGDLDKAKEYLREALRLELNPIYQPSAHYILGLAYHWKGQHAWAIREFEWCLEHDEEGRVAKWKILTGLMNASRKLGLDADAERYSKMLQGVERTHDARPES